MFGVKDLPNGISNINNFVEEFTNELHLQFKPNQDILNIQKEIQEHEEKLKILKDQEQKLYDNNCPDIITKVGLYWQLKYIKPTLILPFISIDVKDKIVKFELNNVEFYLRAGIDDGYTIFYKITCKIPLDNINTHKLCPTYGIKASDYLTLLEFEYIKVKYQPSEMI